MALHRQSRAELEEHLRNSCALLRASCASYDDGAIAEAPRIATEIRKLLHDAGQSRSLLGQLDLKTNLEYLDSAYPISPTNLLSHSGLTMMSMVADTAGSYATYEPRLGELSVTLWRQPRLTFDEWWTQGVISDDRGASFNRYNLMRELANTDGGAHVDPELNEDYAALSRNNSLGWLINADGAVSPMRSPVPASMRQIGFEVEYVLGTQLPALLGGSWVSDPLPIPELRVQHPNWDVIGELRTRLGDDAARVVVTQTIFNVVAETGAKPTPRDFESDQLPSEKISGRVRKLLSDLDDESLRASVTGCEQFLDEEGLRIVPLGVVEQIEQAATPLLERLKQRVGDRAAMQIYMGVMSALRQEQLVDAGQGVEGDVDFGRHTNEMVEAILADESRLASILRQLDSPEHPTA